MTKSRYGVVLGRFQPLHVGHVEYLESARSACRELIVGITSPDISALAFEADDPHRSERDSNPFSYFERAAMVRAYAVSSGWPASGFLVIPADISSPDKLMSLLPEPAVTTVFVTIYDTWGEEKVSRMRALGFSVVVLWRRTMAERVITGTAVRAMMRAGDESWRPFIPDSVQTVLEHDRLLRRGRLYEHGKI